MNNAKVTCLSFVTKKEMLLFLLGFLSCSLLFFASFRFQLVSMDKNLAARWSYIITYGLYALFIDISAILFWWQTISLPKWRKMVSIASGFFLYDDAFALFFAHFLGGTTTILTIINAVLLISILIISFSNEEYIKLVAIGFTGAITHLIARISCFNLFILQHVPAGNNQN